MALTVYQYPKCSTCRKALKWLDQHGVAYKSIDIVSAPLPLGRGFPTTCARARGSRSAGGRPR